MKRLASRIIVASAIVSACATTAWLLRFRVAGAVVERRLAAAGVPASYRITRIGPFLERLEDVTVGDPAAPDLTARRVDILLGYRASGPVVRGIQAEHVRLGGRVGPDGLSLGTLDRLLPRSGAGGVALPELDLAIRDARLTLATPNGTLALSLDGAGNPQRLFTGHAALAAPAVRIATCVLTGVRAELRVVARSGAPAGDGDVDVAHAACPGVALARGRARIGVRSDPALQHFMGNAALNGFAGHAGPARFAGIGGDVEGSGRFGALVLQARLALASLVTPAAVRAVLGAPALDGTPFAPTVTRGRAAVARLLGRADAEITAVLRIRGQAVQANVRRLVLAGTDGARLVAVERGGLAWSARGLRLDADVAGQGGALPPIAVRLRQAAPGAPLAGVARLASYRAGHTRLAIPALRFAWAAGRATFDGRVIADGPVGDGAVRGLDLPMRGWADAHGAFAIGQGCEMVSADALRLGSFRFFGVRLPLCGRPLVAGTRSGALRLDIASGATALHGRTGSGAPVAIAAASARLSERGFAARGLTAVLGEGDAPTRIAVAALDGTLSPARPGGTFAGATARIAAVPLALSDAVGRWRFAHGTLDLAGGLRVADTAATARFRPLAATDARLVLAGSDIRASATLREPASTAAVARVTLAHDLTAGSGGARLVADGIRFVPKGLQPDALTPLTLGVIANVAGLVSGEGRIDWGPHGLTSSGAFGTERLDLAAAFGPVAGIRGRIAFTDLLGLVSAPGQVATVAEINPGVAITDGVVRFHLPGQNRVAVEDARWPFARGTLSLDPATLDLAADRERHLTFHVDALDAGAFVQQLDFPNLSATGTFDGVLPMVFGPAGGRIVAGAIRARPPGGTVAYVGELTTARLGTMGKLAFDALKAIRYSALAIDLDGQLDGEMVSRVGFTGVRQATPDQSLVTRLIRNLPFRFNITVRAPFRGLVGTARSYVDPRLLLQATPPNSPIQPPASGLVRPAGNG